MSETKEKQTVSEKKPSRRKVVIFVIVLLFLIISALSFIYFTQQETKPDPASEKVIREAASYWLKPGYEPYKRPNELTDEDFKGIKSFALQKPHVDFLYDVEVSDIKLLEKFTNLNELSLTQINYPASAIPKWMKILSKFGIYDLKERCVIDLSPFEKLTKLEKLELNTIPIKSIKPLAGLINLKQLQISETQIADLEPIKGLKNLERLTIFNCPNITDKQVEDLQKELPNTIISYLSLYNQTNKKYINNTEKIE